MVTLGALCWSVLLPSGLQGLCSPKEGPSQPCEHEVYQETKIVGLAEPLTQPHTGHTGFGSPALLLLVFAADKK